MKKDWLGEVKATLDEIIGARSGRGTMKEQAWPRTREFSLTPRRAEAAILRIIVPISGRDGVTVVAGKGSFFEIPPGGKRYTSEPLLGELKQVCEAVIDHGLEEWVTCVGSDVLRGEGVVALPVNGPTRVRWRRAFFWPFSKRTKFHTQYAAW